MLIVIHPVLPATVRPNLNAFSASPLGSHSKANASSTALMVITAIRSERSVLHAQLDVPPVAAINA